MGAKWRECALGDLVHIKHGYAFKGKFFGSEGTHVVLTPGNFHEAGGFKEKANKAKWYSGPVPEEYVLEAGDLIVAMTEQGEGLLGSSALVPRPGFYLHNQRLGLVTPLSAATADRGFLYYLFNSRSVRQQIRASANGAKIRHTSPTRIYEVKVRVPDIATQRQIASTLSAYDNLIENNMRRIAILEEMARRIYEDWFVHFRFPGRDGVRMVESALGTVPEGWAITQLGTLLNVEKGLSYKGSGLTGTGVPMVNLKNILPGGGFRRDGTKPYSGEYKPRHVVRAGDIVLANTDLTQAGTVVGSPAIVPYLGEGECIFSHHIYAVRLSTDVAPNSAFIYRLLASDTFKAFAKGHAVGTTVLGMPKEGVTNFEFAKPPKELMCHFSSMVSPMQDMADTLHAKNVILRATRDLLLPKLLSSEPNVSGNPEPEAIAA